MNPDNRTLEAKASIRDYWQTCRLTLKPAVEYTPDYERTDDEIEYSDAETEPPLPARVVLNDLANFMAARPSARVVPGAEWPVIEIGSEDKR